MFLGSKRITLPSRAPLDGGGWGGGGVLLLILCAF